MGDVEAEIDLLYAWRSGDRRAGDELVRAYYPSVFRFFRMRVPEAAEDLTQKTFLACTEGRERVFASSFRAYVFGAAHKLLFKHLDATEKQKQRATFKAPLPQSALTPSGLVSLRQEHWLLLRALERLTLEMQVTIGLHYLEGLRAREIADVLDVPVSTVTTRLSRARAALQREVDTLRAPLGVRETLASDLDAWVRSLGSAMSVLPDAR